MNPTPSVGFNWSALGLDSEVDEVLEIAPGLSETEARLIVAWSVNRSDFEELGAAFRRVLNWIVEAGGIVETGQRMLAVAYVLRPEIFEGRDTLEEIGRKSRVTRAAIDKCVNDFRDTFGVDGRNNRNETTRERCRQAQLIRN